MKTKILTAFIIIANLVACSAQQPLILSPDIFLQTNATLHQGKQANLVVTDLRANLHVIQITKEGDAAKLINSQSSVANVINETLQPEYKKQGLVLTNASNQIIEVSILKAIINVEQTLFKYTSTREIELQVTIKQNGNSTTKKFSLKGNSKGPLKADLAVLGRDFNQGISKLLTQLLNDTELQQAIKS